MWHLVHSHRYPLSFVDEDVSGLQDRVAEESIVDLGDLGLIIGLDKPEFPRLFFDRGVTEQPRRRRNHGEEQVQLSVLLDIGLAEDHRAHGVKTDAEPVDDHLLGTLTDYVSSDVAGGEGMPVGDEEKATVAILQAHPVGQGTVQVTQVKFAGWAKAADNGFGHRVSTGLGLAASIYLGPHTILIEARGAGVWSWDAESDRGGRSSTA